MKQCDLIQRYRKDADDLAQPYRNDDKTVVGWINEAVDEAAIRARLLFDTDATFCAIPIRAGQGVYQLASVIDTVQDAWLGSTGQIVVGTDQSALDRTNLPNVYAPTGESGWPASNWRTAAGTPQWFIQDGRRLQLVPIPPADDVLKLGVYRTTTQNEKLTASNKDQEPVIAAQWHERLLDWVLFRAFSLRDEDQNDDRLALLHEAAFEASFGKRPDANVARKRRERRAHTTLINWPR